MHVQACLFNTRRQVFLGRTVVSNGIFFCCIVFLLFIHHSFAPLYSWTPLDCEIFVKVTPSGQVAIVHDALISFTNIINAHGIPGHVAQDDTLNWFDVYWNEEGNYPGNNKTNSCATNYGKLMSDGSCLLRTTVLEDSVFSDTNVSRQDVMANLFLGALGTPKGSNSTDLGNGVIVHVVGDNVDENTVFEIEDIRGKTKFLKNLKSTVTLQGWTLPPEVFEAESASLNNVSISSFISERNNIAAATGGLYVSFEGSIEGAYVEWDINIENTGDYLLSFRHAMVSLITPTINLIQLALTPRIVILLFAG